MWGFLQPVGVVFADVNRLLYQGCDQLAVIQLDEEDMDINAGTILDGTETVEQVGRRIYKKIISVARERKPRANSLAWEMRNSRLGCLAHSVTQWKS